MNLRALWASVRRWYDAHSTRDRRILLGVALAAVASLVYVGVVDPVRGYRRAVAAEVTDGLEELERSARFLGAADSLRVERDQLKQRLEDAKTRLLPGDSGTLGAAALQERANAIATTKGITVQSTQVMREEAADPFRKVAVRLTLSGELKPFAEFLSGLEYGPQQLTVPFVEVSRRGALPGAKGPRTLAATVEVNGYLRGADKPAKPESELVPPEGEVPGEGEGAPVPAEGEGVPAAASKPAAAQAQPDASAPPPPVAATVPAPEALAGPAAAVAPPAPAPAPPPAEAAPVPPPTDAPGPVAAENPHPEEID